MSAPKYLISTTFQGRKQTKTWDSKSPEMLGRTETGPLWVLEQTNKGQVRIRSLCGAEGEISNAHSQILTPEQVKRGVQVRFKKKEGAEIAVEIKSLKTLHPSLYRVSDENADLTHGFSVYHCVGDWNTEHTNHRTDYIGRLHDKDLFHVMVQGTSAKLRPIQSGLVLEVNGSIQSLDSLVELDIQAADFFKTTVRFGTATWYFAPRKEARRDKLFEIPEKALDGTEFRKISAGAFAFMLLFFGISAILPEKKVEEMPIPPQMVKVLVQKQKAQKKRELPGEKNPDPDKKPLAMSEQVEKVKPAELIVPKGGSQGKKLSNQQVKRINRVQNLYAGIMRGGLNKILDSKSLEGVTKLGSGVNVNKGDLRNLTSAMANLKVDTTAGGTGDSKIVGFGGATGAGVKGPATIGYSDGTKGVISGTGGSAISLGTGDADVEEGLTKEEVGRVIHAHIKEVRYCYESSMVRTARVDGKVILDFTINGQGRVAKVLDRKPASIPDPGLAECIMRRLKTWQFPNPKGGVNVDVSYPFIFKTLGGN